MSSRIWMVSCALLGASAAFPASALEVRRIEGGLVVTGGVGSDERREMTLALPDYNLKVTAAAQRSGEYLADVTLEVRDGRGVRVFDAALDGPGSLPDSPLGPMNCASPTGARSRRRRSGSPRKASAKCFSIGKSPAPKACNRPRKNASRQLAKKENRPVPPGTVFPNLGELRGDLSPRSIGTKKQSMVRS